MNPVFLHKISEVIGHARIIMDGFMRRAPVVPLVENENGVLVGQLFGDGLPIVQSAEKAVEDDEGRALAKCFISEFQNDIMIFRYWDILILFAEISLNI